MRISLAGLVRSSPARWRAFQWILPMPILGTAAGATVAVAWDVPAVFDVVVHALVAATATTVMGALVRNVAPPLRLMAATFGTLAIGMISGALLAGVLLAGRPPYFQGNLVLGAFSGLLHATLFVPIAALQVIASQHVTICRRGSLLDWPRRWLHLRATSVSLLVMGLVVVAGKLGYGVSFHGPCTSLVASALLYGAGGIAMFLLAGSVVCALRVGWVARECSAAALDPSNLRIGLATVDFGIGSGESEHGALPATA